MTFGFRALPSSSPGQTRAGRRFAYAPSSRRSWRSAVLWTAFRRPGIETGIADRAEQHGVSRAAGLEGFRRQRRLADAKRCAPDHGTPELEFVTEPLGDGPQHIGRRAHHFWADSVTGQQRDIRLHRPHMALTSLRLGNLGRFTLGANAVGNRRHIAILDRLLTISQRDHLSVDTVQLEAAQLIT